LDCGLRTEMQNRIFKTKLSNSLCLTAFAMATTVKGSAKISLSRFDTKK